MPTNTPRVQIQCPDCEGEFYLEISPLTIVVRHCPVRFCPLCGTEYIFPVGDFLPTDPATEGQF